MTKQEIARINELAKKAKSENGLNESEKSEQAILRKKYIDEMKQSLRGSLDNVSIQNEDGSITPLSKK